MFTKSNARGAARKAGNIYVEVEFTPGVTAYVQVIKSDLWRALQEYPNNGPVSGIVDDNGDVWIGPGFSGETATEQSRRGPVHHMPQRLGADALINRLDRLEQMMAGGHSPPPKQTVGARAPKVKE